MKASLLVAQAARRTLDLEAENARLRRALLQVVMTLNRSDPFFHLFMEDYSDLLPSQMQAQEEADDVA